MSRFTHFVIWVTMCQAWAFQERQTQTDMTLSEAITVIYSPEDFHYRSENTAPTLVYNQQFFQRFEPVSVGDILKRIPGISGSADAGEFPQPQMRGISPQYTQIQVNGERLPGSSNDRTLMVDRIPAHLVARIEIVRSASADMDAQGIGGTINIVLKEGRHINGMDLLVGVMSFESDNKERGQTAFNYGTSGGRLGFAISGTLQKRHNPKTQHTDLFDAEDELTLKDETNTLETTETALNWNMNLELPGSALLEGRITSLSSEQDQRERADFSRESVIGESTFDRGTSTQDNWGAQVSYRRPHNGLGEFYLSLSHNDLEFNSRLDVGSFEEEEAVAEELETDRTTDRETKLRTHVSLGSVEGHFIKTGLDVGLKDRDARFRLFEIEEGEREEVDFGGVFKIEETRVDVYIVDTWEVHPKLSMQSGLRLEFTRERSPDRADKRDTLEAYPSIHILYRANSLNQYRLSLSRTVKRPNFMDLQPFLQRDRPREGQNTLGNPDLKPEFAVGLDVGYEHRFGNQEGMIGFNLFYRDVKNLVEVVQFSPEGFQVRNLGDGKVYGAELDLGLPLGALGLPNTSLFANLTFQYSRLTDPHSGQRRTFNLQSDHVINLGFLHTFPGAGLSLGMNWLTQGKAEEVLLTERAEIDYGDNLEFLFEAKLKNRWSIRFTARNLLDAARSEILEEYEGLWTEGDLIQRGFESEVAGRSFFLTFRAAFGAPP